jgi:hypothetical protein
MATPTLPPYLGSWDSLLNSLLHNPFLGSSRPQPPRFHTEKATRSESLYNVIHLPPGIFPPSWVETIRPAVEYAVGLINLQQLARQAKSPESQKILSGFAEQAIADFEDDLCPPYRHFPVGWPPPQPWWLLVAVELISVANASTSAEYRESILQLAGQIAERGLAASGNAAQGGVEAASALR